MEDDNNYYKFDGRQKSFSLHLKQAMIKNKVNSAKIFNDFVNISDISKHKIFQKKPIFLKVKKINLKDKNNDYYKKAIKKIFNDVNKYLDNTYNGKKIIIGKECTSKGIKELGDYINYINRKNIKKRRTLRNSELKSNLSCSSKNTKKKESNIYAELMKNNSTEIMKKMNNTNMNINMSMNLNKFVKKDYIKKSPLSDYELRKIFSEGKERERKNINPNLFFSQSNEMENNKKANNTNNLNKDINHFKRTNRLISNMNVERMNINSMLKLQEKILNNIIYKKKLNKKLINKLMCSTFKEKSKLLMNNKKELIIIKNKKINAELNKLRELNKENAINNWLSEFRQINNKENKIINEYKKEVIYSNNNFNESIDIDEKDNNGNYTERYDKDIFKITRNNLFNKYKDKNDNIIYDYNNKKDSISADNRQNKNNNLNFYYNLYIKGKNLLEHESKISKELFGKKKRIIHYSYGADETSNIIFSKSKSSNNIYTPKAIINSIEIHNFRK